MATSTFTQRLSSDNDIRLPVSDQRFNQSTFYFMSVHSKVILDHLLTNRIADASKYSKTCGHCLKIHAHIFLKHALLLILLHPP